MEGRSMDANQISNIIQNRRSSKGELISILEEIQAEYTYLPEQALRVVAEKTGHSLTDIYGVATFYKAFTLKPRGKHCISACLGTACHVRGAQTIVEEFKRQLNIKPGETTPDNEVTFETVNCLGACALGPIVVSDEHYLANVTTAKVKEIIRDTKDGAYGSNGGSAANGFPVEVLCPRCNKSLMDPGNCLDGYPSVLINVSAEGEKGTLRFPSFYGSFTKIHGCVIREDALVTFLCPHCNGSLQSAFECTECGSPLASMKVSGGNGVLRICTRAGCNGHLLDLDGVL